MAEHIVVFAAIMALGFLLGCAVTRYHFNEYIEGYRRDYAEAVRMQQHPMPEFFSNLVGAGMPAQQLTYCSGCHKPSTICHGECMRPMKFA